MKVSVHQIDSGLSHLSLNEDSGSIYQKPASKQLSKPQSTKVVFKNNSGALHPLLKLAVHNQNSQVNGNSILQPKQTNNPSSVANVVNISAQQWRTSQMSSLSPGNSRKITGLSLTGDRTSLDENKRKRLALDQVPLHPWIQKYKDSWLKRRCSD
ncbi:hypothetical protein PORY_000600 [Pneumocystis oryctolagi]|uniref:Uncharacterized protein n=1 Tax=Pneumocystis oryctolagi TaxID=42067 RepID=A0ACB7CDW5_9ASCO|nr:hypothetical protein PORY_000600 [Pneumocystis oryctolagi]